MGTIARQEAGCCAATEWGGDGTAAACDVAATGRDEAPAGCSIGLVAYNSGATADEATVEQSLPG